MISALIKDMGSPKGAPDEAYLLVEATPRPASAAAVSGPEPTASGLGRLVGAAPPPSPASLMGASPVLRCVAWTGA